MGEESTEENVQNCQTVQSSSFLVFQQLPPLSFPMSPLPTTTLLFFIICAFPSPILPLLSAVSKIDWGLLSVLVHVCSIARMCSLSICLGCQGVSWVPASLLLNIYYFLNTVTPPHPTLTPHTPHPILKRVGLSFQCLPRPFFFPCYSSLSLLSHVFSVDHVCHAVFCIGMRQSVTFLDTCMCMCGCTTVRFGPL